MGQAACPIHGAALYRSPVPDLLFEDVRDARVEDVRPFLENPEAAGAGTTLHRVTVFLTYRCNLDCPYCKTIARGAEELNKSPQKRVTYTFEMFEKMLLALRQHEIRHIHFTGGEATLVKDLPAMVRVAKSRGIAYASITSNGTMPFRTYAGLVDAGMDEIRISIDALAPDMGDALAGRRGAWRRTVALLRELAAHRDGVNGRRFFLVANTVVGLRNRERLADIVRFLLSIQPDDIKLITEVQMKGSLGDFPGAEAMLREIESLLEGVPKEAFPLLRRKILTVFAPESIGLEGVAAPPGEKWRCYIPMTERTVDGVNYYPCSVYLREGGDPIGATADSPQEQIRKTAAFVRKGDCLSDPICRRYCLHCTREFNISANLARK